MNSNKECTRYFLPSEIARLVLGYLKEENYMKTYRIFLKECNHLREYEALLRSGTEYPTAIMGLTLLMMLQEYAQLKLNAVQAEHSSVAVSALWNQLESVVTTLKKQASSCQFRLAGGETQSTRTSRLLKQARRQINGTVPCSSIVRTSSFSNLNASRLGSTGSGSVGNLVSVLDGDTSVMPDEADDEIRMDYQVISPRGLASASHQDFATKGQQTGHALHHTLGSRVNILSPAVSSSVLISGNTTVTVSRTTISNTCTTSSTGASIVSVSAGRQSGECISDTPIVVGVSSALMTISTSEQQTASSAPTCVHTGIPVSLPTCTDITEMSQNKDNLMSSDLDQDVTVCEDNISPVIAPPALSSLPSLALCNDVISRSHADSSLVCSSGVLQTSLSVPATRKDDSSRNSKACMPAKNPLSPFHRHAGSQILLQSADEESASRFLNIDESSTSRAGSEPGQQHGSIVSTSITPAALDPYTTNPSIANCCEVEKSCMKNTVEFTEQDERVGSSNQRDEDMGLNGVVDRRLEESLELPLVQRENNVSRTVENVACNRRNHVETKEQEGHSRGDENSIQVMEENLDVGANVEVDESGNATACGDTVSGPMDEVLLGKVQTSLNGSHSRSRERSPKRKKKPPKKRSESLPHVNDGQGSAVTGAHQDHGEPYALDRIINNPQLVERLADNINRSLYLEAHNAHHQSETRETNADISPSSEVREAQDPDPGSRENSLEEFLNTSHKNMPEEAVNDIIRMTRSDPIFQSLFELFNTDREEYIEREFGSRHATNSAQDDQDKIHTSPSFVPLRHTSCPSQSEPDASSSSAGHKLLASSQQQEGPMRVDVIENQNTTELVHMTQQQSNQLRLSDQEKSFSTVSETQEHLRVLFQSTSKQPMDEIPVASTFLNHSQGTVSKNTNSLSENQMADQHAEKADLNTICDPQILRLAAIADELGSEVSSSAVTGHQKASQSSRQIIVHATSKIFNSSGTSRSLSDSCEIDIQGEVSLLGPDAVSQHGTNIEVAETEQQKYLNMQLCWHTKESTDMVTASRNREVSSKQGVSAAGDLQNSHVSHGVWSSPAKSAVLPERFACVLMHSNSASSLSAVGDNDGSPSSHHYCDVAGATVLPSVESGVHHMLDSDRSRRSEHGGKGSAPEPAISKEIPSKSYSFSNSEKICIDHSPQGNSSAGCDSAETLGLLRLKKALQADKCQQELQAEKTQENMAHLSKSPLVRSLASGMHGSCVSLLVRDQPNACDTDRQSPSQNLSKSVDGSPSSLNTVTVRSVHIHTPENYQPAVQHVCSTTDSCDKIPDVNEESQRTKNSISSRTDSPHFSCTQQQNHTSVQNEGEAAQQPVSSPLACSTLECLSGSESSKEGQISEHCLSHQSVVPSSTGSDGCSVGVGPVKTALAESGISFQLLEQNVEHSKASSSPQKNASETDKYSSAEEGRSCDVGITSVVHELEDSLKTELSVPLLPIAVQQYLAQQIESGELEIPVDLTNEFTSPQKLQACSRNQTPHKSRTPLSKRSQEKNTPLKHFQQIGFTTPSKRLTNIHPLRKTSPFRKQSPRQKNPARQPFTGSPHLQKRISQHRTPDRNIFRTLSTKIGCYGALSRSNSPVFSPTTSTSSPRESNMHVVRYTQMSPVQNSVAKSQRRQEVGDQVVQSKNRSSQFGLTEVEAGISQSKKTSSVTQSDNAIEKVLSNTNLDDFSIFTCSSSSDSEIDSDCPLIEIVRKKNKEKATLTVSLETFSKSHHKPSYISPHRQCKQQLASKKPKQIINAKNCKRAKIQKNSRKRTKASSSFVSIQKRQAISCKKNGSKFKKLSGLSSLSDKVDGLCSASDRVSMSKDKSSYASSSSHTYGDGVTQAKAVRTSPRKKAANLIVEAVTLPDTGAQIVELRSRVRTPQNSTNKQEGKRSNSAAKAQSQTSKSSSVCSPRKERNHKINGETVLPSRHLVESTTDCEDACKIVNNTASLNNCSMTAVCESAGDEDVLPEHGENHVQQVETLTAGKSWSQTSSAFSHPEQLKKRVEKHGPVRRVRPITLSLNDRNSSEAKQFLGCSFTSNREPAGVEIQKQGPLRRIKPITLSRTTSQSSGLSAANSGTRYPFHSMFDVGPIHSPSTLTVPSPAVPLTPFSPSAHTSDQSRYHHDQDTPVSCDNNDCPAIRQKSQPEHYLSGPHESSRPDAQERCNDAQEGHRSENRDEEGLDETEAAVKALQGLADIGNTSTDNSMSGSIMKPSNSEPHGGGPVVVNSDTCDLTLPDLNFTHCAEFPPNPHSPITQGGMETLATPPFKKNAASRTFTPSPVRTSRTTVGNIQVLAEDSARHTSEQAQDRPLEETEVYDVTFSPGKTSILLVNPQPLQGVLMQGNRIRLSPVSNAAEGRKEVGESVSTSAAVIGSRQSNTEEIYPNGGYFYTQTSKATCSSGNRSSNFVGVLSSVYARTLNVCPVEGAGQVLTMESKNSEMPSAKAPKLRKNRGKKGKKKVIKANSKPVQAMVANNRPVEAMGVTVPMLDVYEQLQQKGYKPILPRPVSITPVMAITPVGPTVWRNEPSAKSPCGIAVQSGLSAVNGNTNIGATVSAAPLVTARSDEFREVGISFHVSSLPGARSQQQLQLQIPQQQQVPHPTIITNQLNHLTVQSDVHVSADTGNPPALAFQDHGNSFYREKPAEGQRGMCAFGGGVMSNTTITSASAPNVGLSRDKVLSLKQTGTAVSSPELLVPLAGLANQGASFIGSSTTAHFQGMQIPASLLSDGLLPITTSTTTGNAVVVQAKTAAEISAILHSAAPQQAQVSVSHRPLSAESPSMVQAAHTLASIAVVGAMGCAENRGGTNDTVTTPRGPGIKRNLCASTGPVQKKARYNLDKLKHMDVDKFLSEIVHKK